MYLFNKGLRKIPVRITKEELDKANRHYRECVDSTIVCNYILDVQKHFGKNKMWDLHVSCSDNVGNLEKLALHNLGAIIQDRNTKEIDIFFDTTFLYNSCEEKDKDIDKAVNCNCKYIFCFDCERKVEQSLIRRNLYMSKEIIGNVFCEHRIMEVCVFEIRKG